MAEPLQISLREDSRQTKGMGYAVLRVEPFTGSPGDVELSIEWRGSYLGRDGFGPPQVWFRPREAQLNGAGLELALGPEVIASAALVPQTRVVVWIRSSPALEPQRGVLFWPAISLLDPRDRAEEERKQQEIARLEYEREIAELEKQKQVEADLKRQDEERQRQDDERKRQAEERRLEEAQRLEAQRQAEERNRLELERLEQQRREDERLRRERDAAAQTAEIRTDPVESPPGDPSLAPGPRSNLRWAAAAAVLLLCAGVAAWLFIGRKNEPVPLNCKATLALKELDSAEAAFERGRACLDISPCDGIDLMAHAGYRDVPGALLAAAEHLDPRLRPADLPCKEPTASALVMYRYLIEDGVESPDDEKATLAIAQIRAFLTEKAAAGDAAAERDLKENF